MTKLSVFTLDITLASKYNQVDACRNVVKETEHHVSFDQTESRLGLDRCTFSSPDHRNSKLDNNSKFDEESDYSSNNAFTRNFDADELALIVGDSIRLYPVQDVDTCQNSTSLSSYNDDSTYTFRKTHPTTPAFAAIFCHPNLINNAFDQVNFSKFPHFFSSAVNDQELRTSLISLPDYEQKRKDLVSLFSFRLLSLINHFIAENFSIKAIVSLARNNPNQDHHRNYAAADIIIIDLRHAPSDTMIEELMETTSCQTIHSGPALALKVLLLNSVSFDERGSSDLMSLPKSIDIPTCPVCLHRIDPNKLGLPTLKSHQLCSKFCPKPTPISAFSSKGIAFPSDMITCPRQFLLRPWPLPTYCSSCHVVESYWKYQTSFIPEVNDAQSGIGSDLCCSYCSMQETLWVCLTCAFIGCGRYSNKHAAQHNSETSHPFCLELSTGRIWSYLESEYSHRMDLLECPCSLSKISTSAVRLNTSQSVLKNRCSLGGLEANDDLSGEYKNDIAAPPAGMTTFHNNVAASCQISPTTINSEASSLSETAIYGNHRQHEDTYVYRDITPPAASLSQSSEQAMDAVRNNHLLFDVDKSPPKKTILISEEYEALLQSALEEQAHYYESQITSLRAKLTAEQINRDTISENEQSIIEELRMNVLQLHTRINIDVSKELLQYQSKEAGQRATLQRLLNEQRVLEKLIERMRHEIKHEHEQYQLQIQELEYQITDLTTNEKMRHQFFNADGQSLINSDCIAGHSNKSQTYDATINSVSYDELMNAQIITSNCNSDTSSSQQASNVGSGKKLKKSRRLFRR